MTEEILKRIDAFAAKLNTTAAHVWQVLVQQARVEAGICLLDVALLSAVIYGCWRWVRWAYRKEAARPDSYSRGNYLLPACWIGGILSAICLIVSICSLERIPTLLFNPEYWALQQVAGLFK